MQIKPMIGNCKYLQIMLGFFKTVPSKPKLNFCTKQMIEYLNTFYVNTYLKYNQIS